MKFSNNLFMGNVPDPTALRLILLHKVVSEFMR
jgi:hypothetical protein